MPNLECEVTLITESYNLTEGQGWDRLVISIETVAAMANTRPGVEAIVVDPSSDPRVEKFVRSIAKLRYLSVPGFGYDEQKIEAAKNANGRFVIFLDGDCRPTRDDWLDQLLTPLRQGISEAACGTTLYDDVSPRGIASSILDFGYLWDTPGGDLGCYASNNVAFTRATLIATPPPKGSIRCSCYAHAQQLKRIGKPVRHVPNALVLHELPDVNKERWRRGYDLVAVCWSMPYLPETVWLEPTEENIIRFINYKMQLDNKRFKTAPPELGITAVNAKEISVELHKLRRLEIVGLRAALAEGEVNGRNAAARAEYKYILCHPKKYLAPQLNN